MSVIRYYFNALLLLKRKNYFTYLIVLIVHIILFGDNKGLTFSTLKMSMLFLKDHHRNVKNIKLSP